MKLGTNMPYGVLIEKNILGKKKIKMAEKSKMAAIDFHYIDNISITICISICAKEANILLSSRRTCVANFKMIDQLSTELSPFSLLTYSSKQVKIVIMSE